MSRILKTPKIVDDAVLVALDYSGHQAGTQLPSRTSTVVGMEAIMRDARARAEAIVSGARRDAARILSEAQAEVARLQADARERGHAEGHKKGLDLGEAEIERNVQAIRELAQRAHLERTQLIKEAELNIADLAIGVAKTVIGEEVALNPNIVARMVEKAVQKAGTDNPVRIKLHPDDYKTIMPYWEKGSGPGGKGLEWEAVADEQIGRGGCMIDTKFGTVDARIETQLWKIGRSFVELT